MTYNTLIAQPALVTMTSLQFMMYYKTWLLSQHEDAQKRNQISLLAATNLKLATFMFKMMEQCSKIYDVNHVKSKKLLEYQNQWEFEQKKKDDLKVPKVGKSNWAKTMEAIVFHFKLVRGVWGVSLAYLVRQHVKVVHILPGYVTYLNLDKE